MSTFAEELNIRFKQQVEYLGTEKQINFIQPLVSVSVATYQHVDYIKQCLDGILMQKVKFPYEIVIGEDGSIDGTKEICIDYAKKHPDKIRLFIRDRNLSQYKNADGTYSRYNGIWCRMSSRGKYIALCEGDDYWTDPLKLQKQVDFLEEHEEYSMVHSGFLCVDNKSVQIQPKTLRDKQYLKTYHSYMERSCNGIQFFNLLLRRNYILTCTVAIRKSAIVEIHNNYFDYGLFLSISRLGLIGYIPDITACYRRTPGSMMNDPQKKRSFLKTINATIENELFNALDDKKTIEGVRNYKFFRLALARVIINLIRHCPLHQKLSVFRKFLCHPSLYIPFIVVCVKCPSIDSLLDHNNRVSSL